ncbi:MAG: hypothetical protein LUM44_14400 [Pyrinomonadaceae bacterium]|nr:hypothetical protein [Pyrinomonadaceae bacterium]
MGDSFRAELYFIGAMMIFMLIFAGFTIYFFIKTYKKEMREKEAREQQKLAEKVEAGKQTVEN